MASEQTRAQKKKSRNLNQDQHCPQILYRHQDCIPNPKLLHNCEQHRLFGFKNVEEVDSLNKLTGTEEINNIKTKKTNINPKNAKKIEKGSEERDLNIQSNKGTERNNEELSKSRKRRIRKQRLLTSLAPSLKPSNNPGLPLENPPLTKTPSNTCPASSALPVPTSINNDSDLSKTSPKNSRKRFEKSLGFRNKSIKSKSLVDCTNQSKSDIIKSIEEKTLNSLLQTLAPLTNSSPKRENISAPPLFSFPEKRLSCGDNKVDKDSVFYFGETKNQLEKLTSELNKSCIIAQNNQLNENGVSVNNLNSKDNFNPVNISPVSNGSVSNLTSVTQYTNNTNVLPSTNAENKSLFSFGSTDIQSKEIVFKSEDKILSKTNTLALEHTKEFTDNSQHSCSKSSVHIADTIPKQNETNKDLSTMKSTDEVMKTNKSREEILLEREAKKAAKLAAKTKNKINLTKKETAANDSKKADSSETVKPRSKESNIENAKSGLESIPSSLVKDPQNKVLNDKLATNDYQPKEDTSQNPENNVSSKSKAELKAERRAKQEAQRAAKAISKTVQPPKETLQEKPTPKIRKEQYKNDSKSGQTEKKQEATKTTTQPKPKLFSHLYQEKISTQTMKLGGLHPAIVRLGVQYATRVVVGSNARCIALLHALKQMIKAYSTPSEKEFSRGLEEELGPVTHYLHQCRPLAVSMTNALKHIKRSLVQLPNTISDVEARRKMCDLVDTYIHEQIDMAGKAICQTVELKIANGDVILTYGCSSLVCRILVESHLKGKKFRVVVVDGLPWQEGREMLRRLVDKGLSCTYVLITAASFIMREASKVLLGAHALLANGCVMSRAGSSQVALLAHCYNVPVLVCCETHKFSERVQTDAFVYNELGELCCDKIKDKNRVIANLTPLSLAYDITPPDLVSAVVTERAILPCTSVPVILRIKPSESVL